MIHIALKLLGGQEVLGIVAGVTEIEFGIQKYDGKMPRKVFQYRTAKDGNLMVAHVLLVHQAMLLLSDAHGMALRPMFASKPVLEGKPIGENLMFHSNDIVGLNLVIDQGVLLMYSRLAGTISPAQLAPINFTPTHQ